jgi:hypothetical protein
VCSDSAAALSRDQPEADIAPAVMPVELVQEQRAPELWVTGFAIARSTPLPSSASRPLAHDGFKDSLLSGIFFDSEQPSEIGVLRKCSRIFADVLAA